MEDLNFDVTFNDFEKSLFFDCVNTGKLIPITGNFIRYNNIKIFTNFDNDSILTSQQKKCCLKELGEGYEKIYITYKPSITMEYFVKDNEHSAYDNLLNNPLIKISKEVCEKEKPTSFDCFLSGKRSAIIFSKDHSIRLKGCGNVNIGFNIANVPDLGPEHNEIRGAQFKNTCLDEQFITRLVENKLREYNLISANSSLGFWKYAEFSHEGKKFGLVNEAPLMDKYCGLFKTNGDKRVGQHFFNGLNHLINNLLNQKDYLEIFHKDLFNFKEVTESLPGKNFDLVKGQITYNNFITDNLLYDRKTLSFDEFTKENLMFDFRNFLKDKKDKSTKELLKLERNYINALLKNALNTSKKSSHFKEKDISNLVESLFHELEKENVSLFENINSVLSKISFEIARVKRIFVDIDLNWGTYDYHSNAHLDNFIVLNENRLNLFTAPLDFDLAFCRNQFISSNYKNTNFDELVVSERNLLSVQLQGINMIPNIEVNVLDLKPVNEQFKDNFENIRTILVENMQNYFLKGYFNIQDVNHRCFEKEYKGGILLNKLLLLLDSLLS